MYEEFIKTICSDKFNLDHEWRYYHDGKSWLLKISHKNKTIIWSSIITNSLQVTFYFPNRPDVDIKDLDIDTDLITQYEANKKEAKKSTYITIPVNDKHQLKDIYTLIEYKKAIK